MSGHPTLPAPLWSIPLSAPPLSIPLPWTLLLRGPGASPTTLDFVYDAKSFLAGGDIQVYLNKLECRGKVHLFQ